TPFLSCLPFVCFFCLGAGPSRTYSLSLHDALPISGALEWVERGAIAGREATPRVVLTPHAGELAALLARCGVDAERGAIEADPRSEEHTSELQSRFDLVCRLLLEKKNTA